MRQPGHRGMNLRGRARRLLAEQISHGETAETQARLAKKLPAGLKKLMFEERVHEEKLKNRLGV